MRWVKSILRGFLLAVLLILCAALFYVLVIMGDAPQTELQVSMVLQRFYG